ncbi:MAG: glucose/arabinose dehydrogenase [Gammaproteobacteria bacterium]|jgi:glucose/arabinose dehydrogenase
MVKFLLSITTAYLLQTASFVFAQVDNTFGSALHSFRVVTVVKGLDTPWSMAWLPDGAMLVTERSGDLRIVRDGVLSQPVEGVPTVHAKSQGGLFDVLPHRNYSVNKLVYLSYAQAVGKDSTTVVVRGRLEDDRLANIEKIFQAKTSGRDGHYGGRLAFDYNGHLFITVGERQASTKKDLENHPAQDRSNHQGVVVRIHDDGRIPADNPFVGKSDILPEIWSYGHRNPQGLAIHPITGDVWEGEHGPQGGDELNIIQAGLNYGWPVVGYGVNYGSGAPIHSNQTLSDMEPPLHYWVPSIATSGLMIYGGDKFPKWQGNIFIGGLKGRQLARITLSDDAKLVENEETLVKGLGRIRDVRQGPDGFIYLADESNGVIVRLEPSN